MSTVISWCIENWQSVFLPLAVFLLALLAMFWLRRRAYHGLVSWARKTRWPANDILLGPLTGPSQIWALILSAYLALMASNLPGEWRDPTGKTLWSLFLASMTLSVLNIIGGLIRFYGPRIKASGHTIVLINNVSRIVVLAVAFLILLGIWGVPTTPILFLLGVAVLAALFAFRDAVPNLTAGFQLSAGQQIKVGDYVKLESGEEGYVREIGWRSTRIQALDESMVIIPNSHLVQKRVVNYGRPLKKAQTPFRFNSRSHLTELTGVRANTLRELADALKQVPDAVIYYHTHHFLEEYHQLTPELSNDFAVWVSDALGEEVLGERLASIDTFSFPNIAALRDRFVSVIEEHISKQSNQRVALEGRSFYFMKSVSIVLPSPYVAHDLREMVEALRKITPSSLYFHIFEARLRVGQGLNDFSIWLDESLGDKELSEEVARLDPYLYTLEGLRSALIQLMEKRIK